MKIKIEIDFDGVLYNLNGNVLKIVGEELGIYINEQTMTTYNYGILPENIRQKVFEKFKSLEIMVNEKFLFSELIKFLQWADNLENTEVELRTLVKDSNVMKKRKEFLEHLFFKHRIQNIKINVVSVKREKHCDILIEDNPDAINRKNNGLVIIKSQPYNKCIPDDNIRKRANNFTEVKELILKYLEEKQKDTN